MQDNDDISIETDGFPEGGSEEELEEVEGRVDAKVQKLKKELEQVKKERAEYLDGWQRAKADYVNAAKRFEEDRMKAVALGKLAAFKAFLPAMDSLIRAKATGEIPESFAGIAKQLEDAASSHGLSPFGEVGEAFDPALHEALGQDAGEKDQEDTVSAVLEQGWKVGEEVVRPARVRVWHSEV